MLNNPKRTPIKLLNIFDRSTESLKPGIITLRGSYTSSDGQKQFLSVELMNANYSYKHTYSKATIVVICWQQITTFMQKMKSSITR